MDTKVEVEKSKASHHNSITMDVLHTAVAIEYHQQMDTNKILPSPTLCKAIPTAVSGSIHNHPDWLGSHIA